jgi:hypothetical protein
MKPTRRISPIAFAAAIVAITIALPGRLLAQSALGTSSGTSGSAAQWSVQVDKVNPSEWTSHIPSRLRSTKTSWRS